jgi:leucyl aminopeptidase
MDFELKTLTRSRVCTEKCDALVVLVPQHLAEGDDTLSMFIEAATQSGDFERKPGKLLQAYRTSGIAATRVVLVGAGEGTAKHVRTAVNAAMGTLKGSPAQRVVLCLGLFKDADASQMQAAVMACGDAAYTYSATKSKVPPVKLQRMVLAVADATAAKAGFEKAVGLVKGIALAKEWGNRPANYATPVMLAGAARELAKLPRIKAEILGPKEVAKLGMGSFMAVARGSEEPLRFIVLRYDGGLKADAPVVLVGKGITFDTGGISIKPASEMDEMKFDMCGAASVLGAFRTLGALQPKLNVIGLIPSCENMPDGKAIKPGDVVTSMSGQTIEILNTDAEGRLVLCDALTYAERFKPRAVVDIATLTGACVVALGAVRSGLFSSDDALAQSLLNAGERSLDLCWRMPLDDEYADGLKSNFADVANVAGRAGGSVTAAKFLQRFAGKFAWAHLDIAGTAWKGGAAKGSTGRPVALLVEYLLEQAAEAAKKPLFVEAKTVSAAVKKASARPAVKALVKAPAKTRVKAVRA